jgi:hypothetical protein
MNKRIAPWFLVTLYDADACEVCTDEVQGRYSVAYLSRGRS